MNGTMREGDDQVCCLVDNGVRCSGSAGNASYSKRIQKTVLQRKLKLGIDQNARHIYICDHHKGVIQSVRPKRRRRESEGDSERDGDQPVVDLSQLQINTLKRYKKIYKLNSQPGMNKTQLAEMLLKHLHTIPVAEKEILTYFIYMIKSNSSKLDQKTENSSGDNS